MAFFMGALTGLATSLDEGLKKNLADTDKKIETIALRESELRREERKELREQDKAIKDVLDGLSGFVDASKLPAGASAYDAAAAIFQNQAGGNLAEGQALISSLSESRKLGLDTNLVLDQVVASNLSAADIRRQFIDYPEQRAIPEAKGIGFLKGASLKDKISAAITEPEITGRPETEAAFGMAEVDLSKLAAAKEYAKEQQMFDIKLQNAILGNQKLQRELSQFGTLDDNQIQEGFDRVLKTKLQTAGIPAQYVNGVLSFDVSTATEGYKKAQVAHEQALVGLAQTVKSTNSFGVGTNNATIRGLAQQVKSYYPNGVPPKAPNKNSFDGMIIGRMYTIKQNGEFKQILWTGDKDNLFRVD